MIARWFVYGLAVWFLLAGIWTHDVWMILAPVVVLLCLPAAPDGEDDGPPLPVCAGCSKGRLVPGCPVHDEQQRKVAA